MLKNTRWARSGEVEEKKYAEENSNKWSLIGDQFHWRDRRRMYRFCIKYRTQSGYRLCTCSFFYFYNIYIVVLLLPDETHKPTRNGHCSWLVHTNTHTNERYQLKFPPQEWDTVTEKDTKSAWFYCIFRFESFTVESWREDKVLSALSVSLPLSECLSISARELSRKRPVSPKSSIMCMRFFFTFRLILGCSALLLSIRFIF